MEQDVIRNGSGPTAYHHRPANSHGLFSHLYLHLSRLFLSSWPRPQSHPPALTRPSGRNQRRTAEVKARRCPRVEKRLPVWVCSSFFPARFFPQQPSVWARLMDSPPGTRGLCLRGEFRLQAPTGAFKSRTRVLVVTRAPACSAASSPRFPSCWENIAIKLQKAFWVKNKQIRSTALGFSAMTQQSTRESWPGAGVCFLFSPRFFRAAHSHTRPARGGALAYTASALSMGSSQRLLANAVQVKGRV